MVEEAEKGRLDDKKELETRAEELNTVAQQKDQLSQFNDQLKAKISDLEENLITLQGKDTQ